MSKSLKRAFTAIGVFFVLLFLAGGYTLALAFKHSEPILNERYYEVGLDYEKRLQKLRLASEEGWELNSKLLTERNLPYSQNSYEITLTVPEGIQPEKVTLDITIDRPASSKWTVKEHLNGKEARVTGSEYRFTTALKMPAPGYADIKLEANIDDRVSVYKSHRAYVVRK